MKNEFQIYKKYGEIKSFECAGTLCFFDSVGRLTINKGVDRSDVYMERAYYEADNERVAGFEQLNTMVGLIVAMNDDDRLALELIYTIKGVFNFIKNPSPKQKRLNAIRWKI